MGMLLFSRAPGKMVAIETAFEPVVFRWKEDGDTWDSREMLAIITRIGLTAGTQEQLSATIGGQLYLYVFGDKPGVLNMEGVAFDAPCESAGGPQRSGFDHLLNYYERKKLSSRMDPIRIVLGSQVITAYLNALSIVSEETELHTWRFSLSFLVIPKLPPIGRSRVRVGAPGSPVAPSPPSAGIGPITPPGDVPVDAGGAVIGGPVVVSPPGAGEKGYVPVGTGPSLDMPGGFVVDG